MKPDRIVIIFTFLMQISLQIASSQDISRNAGKRLALVIGNGKYQYANALPNPVNDARAMRAALTEVGFYVLEYENLDQTQMKMAIDDFGSKLKNYSTGLFFYAGHGIQSKGLNYLVPVNASLKSEMQIEYDCVQADRVLGQMEDAGSTINIVILDACRNNPFERSWSRAVNGGGLAFMNAPTGSLIAYATSPGRTASDGSGSNGLYTSALLENIKTPGINILQMFQNVRRIVGEKSEKQQIPWESTSLTNDFFFVNDIVSSTALQNTNAGQANSLAINNPSREMTVRWKRDDKSYWLYYNGQEISSRLTGSWSDNDWMVYDPVTNNTYLLKDYNNQPFNQDFIPVELGNTSDAWWRYDGQYYMLYVKGIYIATRTRAFADDPDLLVYDGPTNTTYIFKDYKNCSDSKFRPAGIFDNAEYAFWRRIKNTYWLYVKGEEIEGRTKCGVANKDVLVYDSLTNITYLLQDFYVDSTNTKLRPARVVSYMDDILWMKSQGNTYWLYVKGEMISNHTTTVSSGNDLYVTDTDTKITYLLSDYFNAPEDQFRPAYKSTLY
jgi:hypothetical protein